MCLQAFFIKWWAVQPSTVRDRVRGLVAAGQLQFVNGGLVQHDEATSHYSSIIDHMGVGMRWEMLWVFHVSCGEKWSGVARCGLWCGVVWCGIASRGVA